MTDRRKGTMPRNPPIHTHFCPEPLELGGHRYQCLRVGCVAPDVWACEDCLDALLPWPEYDPWAEHSREEVRAMLAMSELGVLP